MHIGTVRTALFNFLWAKRNGGTFFVRIEDTDTSRNRAEWTQMIWDDFAWCGLEPDKKYIQSEHLPRHQELLQKLVAEGKAYSSIEPSKDDPAKEVEVIRFKNPGSQVTFADVIHGDITIDTTDLGDFVIARSVGQPLYHFAVVVDDADAGVTHIIRGEDILSSTARQILIQEALGFARPIYVHLPLILGDDRKKLSKRRQVVSLEDYKKAGYIPEGIINYLALLGWNPGTPQEIFTIDELIEEFSLERINHSGAVFDTHKLLWVNHQHLKRLSDVEYAERLREFSGKEVELILVPLLKERAQTLGEAATVLTEEFGFLSDITYDASLLLNRGKISAEVASNHLNQISSMTEHIPNEGFSASQLKDILMPYADSQGRGDVLWPLRTALSGREKSPDPFTLMALLGKDKSRERIAQALQKL